MKVLVLNGSPKRDASDTMHITRAFLEGMGEGAQVEAEIIHVIDRHIEFCRGCFACKRNGGRCAQQDDMAKILQRILAADVLLFNFPLYCYGMPAALKNLIDRTMPLSAMAMQKVGERYEHVGQADYEHLRYVMICGCGFPNSRHNFEPAVAQFKLMFNAPEAAPVTAPRLKLVQQAGREYAQTGEISPALLEQLASPMIPEDMYARIANGEAPE